MAETEAKQSDSSEGVFAKLEAAAREHGIRSVVAIIGAGAYIVHVPGAPGIVTLDGGDTELYERLEAEGHFDDPAAARAWVAHAQAVSKEGIKLRQQGLLAEAYRRQRFSFFVTARTRNLNGVSAIANNVWTIREGLRDIFVRFAGPPRGHWETDEGRRELEGMQWANATITHDALVVTRLIPPLLEDVERDSGTSPFTQRLLYALHRIARMAGDVKLRRATFERLAAEADASGGHSFVLLAALDELAQLDLASALVAAGLLGPADDDDGASASWPVYQSLRARLSDVNDPMALISGFLSAFRQLNFLRMRVTTGGGGFSHELSYALSVLLQSVGRDFVAVLRAAGDQEGALSVAEHVQSRSMSDWMGRTHALWKLPHWWAAAMPPISGSVNAGDAADLDDIRAAAAALEAPLLYYLSLHDGLASWVVLQDGSVLPIEVGEVTSALSRVHDRLPFAPPGSRDAVRDIGAPDVTASQAELDDALRDLHDALFPQQLQDILAQAGERLVIVLDAALNTVPFAALKAKDGRYLIESHELIVLPSVTAWMAIESGSRLPIWRKGGRDERIAPVVLGKTTFEVEYEIRDPHSNEPSASGQRVRFGGLPGAGTEASEIGKLLGVEPLLEGDATLGAVFRATGAEVLHLATHGFLDEEHPRSSFLVLSDRTLTADQLYRYDPGVRAGLVVLSACRTGLGGAHPDSVIGLANAFMIAGARSVVSTLWPIRDIVTAKVMTSFYRHLLEGGDISRALRLAQLEALQEEDTSHPYYWAAFRMVGRPANPFEAIS